MSLGVGARAGRGVGLSQQDPGGTGQLGHFSCSGFWDIEESFPPFLEYFIFLLVIFVSVHNWGLAASLAFSFYYFVI